MLLGRRAVAQQNCAAISDGDKPLGSGLRVAFAFLPPQTLFERHGDRTGNCLAGKIRQFTSEPARFCVLDPEVHAAILIRVNVAYSNPPSTAILQVALLRASDRDRFGFAANKPY